MSFPSSVGVADDFVREHLGGVTVSYLPDGWLDPVPVVGMFDEQYVLMEEGATAGVGQVTPALWVAIADLPVHPDVDDPRITIAGTTYSVREHITDGMGGVRLLLHRAGA